MKSVVLKELSEILNIVNKYHAVEPVNEIFSPSYPCLKERLEKARSDSRWTEFKDCIREGNGVVKLLDMTIYIPPTACFKSILTLDTGIKKYMLVFYISIISDYYAYKTKAIYTEVPDIATMLASEKDDDLMNQLKSLFGRKNFRIDMYKQKEELIKRLKEIPRYKEVIEREEIFKRDNPLFFNETPEEIRYLVKPLLDCQERIFNYQLFDKSYAGITFNENGTITLFDGLFTDFDDFSQL